MSTSTTDLLVRDVCLPLDRTPTVAPDSLFKHTLEEMTRFRLGIACVVDDQGKLAGIITDGDIRRMLLKDQKPFSYLFADDAIQHAKTTCTTVAPDMRLIEALATMEAKEIWDLPVVDGDGRLVGLLHLHPAIKAVLGMRAI